LTPPDIGIEVRRCKSDRCKSGRRYPVSRLQGPVPAGGLVGHFGCREWIVLTCAGRNRQIGIFPAACVM